MFFFMCREAFYTVLCNTLLQKKHVSVGKVGALKIFLLLFYFPLQKGPVAVFR